MKRRIGVRVCVMLILGIAACAALMISCSSGARVAEPRVTKESVPVAVPKSSTAKVALPTPAKQPAALPESEQAAWRQAPEEKVSAVRSVICLNGWWKFTPVAEKKDIPWGYLRVPGSWSRSQHWSGCGVAEVVKGEGEVWAKWNSEFGKEFNKAFYERTIRIPESWTGRSVILDFAWVSTDAKVYVDGAEAGKVEWPAGQVDITPFVMPGKDAVLTVFVAAVPEAGELVQFMETFDRQVSKSQAVLHSRGLTGDVTLIGRPKGAHIGDLFVKTSWRERRVAVEAELVDVPEDGEVAVAAVMLDESGKQERRFTATASVRKAALQVVEVSWPWDDPRLWDLDAPNLYTCRFSADGAGVKDEYAQEFGFREFWIEGRYYKLNGLPIRLRPCLAESARFAKTETEADAWLAAVRAQGFNFSEQWPENAAERSVWFPVGNETLARRADRKGFLLSGVAMHLNNDIMKWDKPGVKEGYERRMAADLRRQRNHPSYIMWGTSGNFFGNKEDMDPRHVGRTGYFDTDKGWRRNADRGTEGIAMIKKVDPTRPVFTHQGAYVGDLHTCNLYLNLTPLQEREDYLSDWATKGELPYFAVEFEMPINLTFRRSRSGHSNADQSEPWVTEFCAGSLGREAYALEEDSYRKGIIEGLKKPGDLDPKTPDNLWRQRQPVIHEQAAFQKLLAKDIQGVWRSWRTWGLSGGMLPWNSGHAFKNESAGDEEVALPPFQPGARGLYLAKDRRGSLEPMRAPSQTILPAGKAFKENNSDLLAWIAGPPESFTSKDHSFTSGRMIAKQAALLNDSRVEKTFELAIQVSVAGKECFSFQKKGQIKPGETLFVPFEFAAPEKIKEVSLPRKADGVIKLSAVIGGKSLEDSFRFRVFRPSSKSSVSRTVIALDQKGDTRRMLDGLQVSAIDYAAGSLAGGASVPLLVIGRKALEQGGTLPEKMEEFVKSGGSVLVMAQDPEVVRENWGFRMCGIRSRQVFMVRDDHPVMIGCDDEDLRDWAGESSLVEPYPTRDQMKIGKHGLPFYGYYWGSKGVVATSSFEKPHLGGWTPILECEFDLQYSPLMELDYGAGKVILCSLDLEDHWQKDAAAAELARGIIEHAANTPVTPRAKDVVYVGDEKGERLLKLLGAGYRKSAQGERDAELTILGPGADLKVKPVGRIFLLPGARKELLVLVKDFHGSINVPNWSEARGLSPSDLHWRVNATADVLQPGDGLVAAADGLLARSGDGKTIACQADPELFDVAAKPYCRFTRWRQTRTLSQLLANLGATFEMDKRVFTFANERNASRISLAGTWKAKLTKVVSEAEAPDKPQPDAGFTEEAKVAVKTAFDDSSWKGYPVGKGECWESYGGEWAHADGEAVFRRTFDVPANWAGQELVLSLGAVDDFDNTFIDGVEVGAIKGWNVPRRYVPPSAKLTTGTHTVAVRVWDHFGGGGFSSPADDIFIGLKNPPEVKGFYHPDYRDDFDNGDDPYRFYRW